MKNTVRIIVFVLLLGAVGYVFRDEIQHNYISLYSVLITLSAVIIVVIIFLENRKPSQTLTWLVVFSAFPLIGFIFYFLFGRNYYREKMYRKKYFVDRKAFLEIDGFRNVNKFWPEMGAHQQNLFQLARRIGNSPISVETETSVLTNGQETFSELLKQLKQANHHIHMEYYIIRNDSISKEVKSILIDRAKSGVKVRFLIDAVGSWQLPRRYLRELKENGVEVAVFGPVNLPFLNSKLNFRNHRKIVVIDGDIGFVGGLNIGDEYLGLVESFGFWRDTHLLVRGEAVRTLQLIFLQDWYYCTNTSFLSDAYLRVPQQQEVITPTGAVQMVAGGPDNEYSVIKNIFFSMITSARKSVWIASPYFIPDEDIFQAIKIAALSGIDVRLLVPQKPDKWFVWYASRSYFPELLEVGVKIYQYEQGFMHSKIVIVDHELASIGTANMDMRSFHLNFEVNAFLYKTESIEKLVSDYLEDLEHANLLAIETFNKRHFGNRILESTCRLLSPML